MTLSLEAAAGPETSQYLLNQTKQQHTRKKDKLGKKDLANLERKTRTTHSSFYFGSKKRKAQSLATRSPNHVLQDLRIMSYKSESGSYPNVVTVTHWQKKMEASQENGG